jgi:hypothetical protein
MSNAPRLMIFASPRDPHVTAVVSAIQSEGVDCVIFSPVSDEDDGEFPSISLSEFNPEQSELGRDVWWLRNKHRTIAYISPDDQRRELESKTREDLVRSLISLGGARSFNNVGVARTDKLWQLSTAQKLGFRIPETLIGGSKPDVLNFVRRCEGAIVKPFGMSFVPARSEGIASFVSIMTNLVTVDEIVAATPTELHSVPAIFQERVIKDHELRVIAFSDKCVGFRINSQANPDTAVDWRRGIGKSWLTDDDPIDLPDELVRFTRDFLSCSGLDSGVFDFAVTPNGEIVFFECNPSGQWADLDRKNGLVSRMFAEGFLRILAEPPQTRHLGADWGRLCKLRA